MQSIARCHRSIPGASQGRTAYSGAVSFEPLERRQLQSVSSPSPTDGNDYHLILDDNGSDSAAQAIRSASAGTFVKKGLPGGFQWVDGTPNQVLTTVQGSTFTHSVVESWSMWPFDPNTRMPIKSGATDETNTRAMARAVSTWSDLLIIDIEDWRMDIRGSSRATVNQSMDRFKQLLGWIRDERPQLKIGIYGYMSLSDNAAIEWAGTEPGVSPGGGWYQDYLAYASNSLGEWQATSEYLRPVSEYVDYMFPALHTGSTDPAYWTAEAKSIISDSRRYGKPVIPFICPYYHSAAGAIAGQELDPQLWQHELEVVRAEADGALIWTDINREASLSWVSAAVNASAGAGAVAASIAVPMASSPASSTAAHAWNAAAVEASVSAGMELANDPSDSRFADEQIV